MHILSRTYSESLSLKIYLPKYTDNYITYYYLSLRVICTYTAKKVKQSIVIILFTKG